METISLVEMYNIRFERSEILGKYKDQWKRSMRQERCNVVKLRMQRI
jgi:hypothetical protein